MRNTKQKKAAQMPSKKNPNRAKSRPRLPSAKWLIHAATVGHLKRVRNRITVKDLARAKCGEGYSALHYAARFGHLRQIRGGVAAEQLAHVKSSIGWIWTYNTATGWASKQTTDGITALAVAAQYGHLNQVKDTVTLATLRSARNADGTSALDSLREEMQRGMVARDLANNLIACPELVKFLDATVPDHLSALRRALRRDSGIERRLTPTLTAALL
jgi:hypothetical protein